MLASLPLTLASCIHNGIFLFFYSPFLVLKTSFLRRLTLISCFIIYRTSVSCVNKVSRMKNVSFLHYRWLSCSQTITCSILCLFSGGTPGFSSCRLLDNSVQARGAIAHLAREEQVSLRHLLQLRRLTPIQTGFLVFL